MGYQRQDAKTKVGMSSLLAEDLELVEVGRQGNFSWNDRQEFPGVRCVLGGIVGNKAPWHSSNEEIGLLNPCGLGIQDLCCDHGVFPGIVPAQGILRGWVERGVLVRWDTAVAVKLDDKAVGIAIGGETRGDAPEPVEESTDQISRAT